MASLRCALAVLLLLAAAPAARAITIAHEGAGCVIADRFPRFEARLDPAGEIARARVFFRAVGTPHWYSVDMTAGAAGFTGILPKPRRTTPRIEYYVEASDRAFASARTPERIVAVVGSAGECETNALVAPVSASARVVVTAMPGAPAVPAGFLSAGLAGAGGVSALTLGVIGGGAAAAAGVAVAAGGGDGSDPPPTTAAATLTGSWVGLGADGLHRELTQSGVTTWCRNEDDLYLELQQSGRTLTGSARYVARAGSACDIAPGATFRTDVRGTVDGQQVRLTLTATLAAGDYADEFVGTVAGSHMEGTFAGNWHDGARSGQIRGAWSARRP
jgi:hypothetical protein